jgi:hypothetical protein
MAALQILLDFDVHLALDYLILSEDEIQQVRIAHEFELIVSCLQVEDEIDELLL